MDTPFLMPNADWTGETDIFSYFTITFHCVCDRVNQLLNGINKPNTSGPTIFAPYPFDWQNLLFSATYFKASLTPKFWHGVLHSVGLDTTSIKVFMCILHCKLHVIISL